MEQVYRRRGEHSAAGYRSGASRFSGYKQTALRQSVLCLFLFIVCLFVKVSQEPRLEAVRSSIRLILDVQTDFAAIPGHLRSFIRTYILRSEERGMDTKEVVTALIRPVDAPVISPFGLREHPIDGADKFHYGVDLGAAAGDKIKCTAAGTVAETGESPDYGNYILVRHPDEIYSLYAHCQSVLPQVNDSVLAGQVIATVGETGKTTGPHLHFELRNGETWLDPGEFIDFGQENAHD